MKREIPSVPIAQKNGMTLLCVILDSNNPAHYNDTENLFEYCFQNFSLYSVADNVNLSDMSDQAALGSLSDKIDLIRVDEDGVVVLPNTASFTMRRRRSHRQIKMPIREPVKDLLYLCRKAGGRSQCYL